eukprot:TRINITY_DN70169_c0_g1_i1.p1 TRINITY_DN70169_c0_g1~~TRINITY_DN70169_c0_g1_i1.p1  ORF type:complete len:366 (-),score=38.39 TRINITY_DN70169_c0_g1_i1:110-1207(-)
MTGLVSVPTAFGLSLLGADRQREPQLPRSAVKPLDTTEDKTDQPPVVCNSHVDALGYVDFVYRNAVSGFGSDFANHADGSPADVDNSNLQYGEVTNSGMETLYSAFELKPGDVFYDLGSGTGKLVLYVALRGVTGRSVGLEIGTRRHAIAELARDRLALHLGQQNKDASCQQAIRSSEGDATPATTAVLKLRPLQASCAEFAVHLADISRFRYQDVSVVSFCNICMEMGLQNRTLGCLLRCPSLRRLVTATPMVPHARLRLRRSVRVACTWARISSWHVYDVLEPQPRKGRLDAARGYPLCGTPAVATSSRRRTRSASSTVTATSCLTPMEEKEFMRPEGGYNEGRGGTARRRYRTVPTMRVKPT